MPPLQIKDKTSNRNCWKTIGADCWIRTNNSRFIDDDASSPLTGVIPGFDEIGKCSFLRNCQNVFQFPKTKTN